MNDRTIVYKLVYSNITKRWHTIPFQIKNKTEDQETHDFFQKSKTNLDGILEFPEKHMECLSF